RSSRSSSASARLERSTVRTTSTAWFHARLPPDRTQLAPRLAREPQPLAAAAVENTVAWQARPTGAATRLRRSGSESGAAPRVDHAVHSRRGQPKLVGQRTARAPRPKSHSTVARARRGPARLPPDRTQLAPRLAREPQPLAAAAVENT